LKRGFDPDVELLLAALEPATSARAKGSRLFDFTQAENRAVKFASGRFAALWGSQLDVIDTSNHWIYLALGHPHLAMQPQPQ
jgi:hypothetical protein